MGKGLIRPIRPICSKRPISSDILEETPAEPHRIAFLDHGFVNRLLMTPKTSALPPTSPAPSSSASSAPCTADSAQGVLWESPVRVEPGKETITIDEALDILRAGGVIIVVDDECRENEGDFIFAAQHVTREKVNLLLKYGRGMVCVPAPREWLHRLDLDPMVPENTAKLGTNFTVTVDHRDTSTGISADDRARTIQALADPSTRPEDLLRPGHINPLEARDGGVLRRAGHTEATVDLMRAAGLQPVAVLCEILKDDGSMARMPDLIHIARRFHTPIITIRDLIAWRTQREKLVRRVLTTTLPNAYGAWTLHMYENIVSGEETLALVLGDPASQPSALVRVHSKCLTGEVFGSLRCECGAQLETAMKMIAQEGHGVLIYLDQEGRGIGLRNKLFAYCLQDQGKDTVEANEALGFKADLREYGIGAQILADLGLRRIRIMTNNPRKIVGIQGFGLEVVGRVPIEVGRQPHNEAYLRAKALKLGHIFQNIASDCESDSQSTPSR